MNSEVPSEQFKSTETSGLEVSEKRTGLSKAKNKALYNSPNSFVDYLPWVEYLEDKQAILLEDGLSVGAIFDILPIGTEGRTEEYLSNVRNTVEEAIQDSFEERDVSPWILQTYTFDVPDLDSLANDMEDYVKPHAKGTAFTNEYLRIMRKHYRGISKEGGLFVDSDVTKTQWGGKIRKSYLVIYRRLSSNSKSKISDDELEITAAESLNETCEKFTNALKPIRVNLRRLNGQEFHQWLQAFFNPSTELYGGDIRKFLEVVRQEKDDLPIGNEFSETMLYSHPRSDFENNCWWFGGTAIRAISIDGIRKRPEIGHTTGEILRGDSINTMMDLLPEGTVMVSTTVIVPQDTIEQHIAAIQKAAIGDSSDATRTNNDCNTAKKILGEKHKFYRAKFSFFIKAQSIEQLNKSTNMARGTLLNYGFRAINSQDDVRALDNFILSLPMVYNADRDRLDGWRQAQITVVQHLANMSCFFGRGRGTGHPGITAFNRGGEPVSVDPLNPEDRQKNAHGLILGPTGAGKSATLVSNISQVVAIHRPRVFIIEVGNSFGLMGDWYKSLGLTVNQVMLKPGSGVKLPPFADAHKAFSQTNLDSLDGGDKEEETSEDGEEQRDILGEMEIIAKLMITGGEEKEANLLRRSDRRLIRDAILEAAEKCSGRGKETQTQDVRDAFYEKAKSPDFDPQTQKKLREMGDSIGLFCDGFEGEVFNSSGQSWPESDVTIIDLATFAREGYEPHLAIAVIGCINMINNIAERDQHDEREIMVVIDEAHIVTTNPLLAPFLVKVVKMWRKLGAWLWLGTQNLEDFPLAAKKMLNMIEWWICLVMPKEEVEEIVRFRNINESQKKMLLSASKSPKKYTEGVILSEKIETLFRIVPPSEMLALGLTEKHEKAVRAEIMKETGVQEYEAALKVAAQIDKHRGIQ